MNRTSDIEIYIIVEGQTEQTFVRDILAPQIAQKGIYLRPALLGRPGHKGGDVRFDRARQDIGIFLKQRSHSYISTMFDYYRIDKNWPGKKEVDLKHKDRIKLTACQKAEFLESASKSKIIEAFPKYNPKDRFIPYIEMHEFEALIFSNPSILADTINVDRLRIEKILDEYNDNPEEINEDPDKTPSKRLIEIRPGYRKIVMGKTVAEKIGIQKIRQKCPHFDDWLTKLENLK